jgi:heme exporter protein D
MIWLAAVVVVGVVAAVIAGLVWGLIAAGATLLASEVVERARRQRLRTARGAEGSALREAIGSRRRRR